MDKRPQLSAKNKIDLMPNNALCKRWDTPIQRPLETLRTIALANAQVAAADAHITFEDKRQVNGKDILCLQINGTIQGIPFVYLGYYYSNSYGTAQLITYTAGNLFEEYQNDFEEFLNGFEVSDSALPSQTPRLKEKKPSPERPRAAIDLRAPAN